MLNFYLILFLIPFLLPLTALFLGLKFKSRKTYLTLDILTQMICILPIGLFFVSLIFSGDLDPAAVLIGFYMLLGILYILVAQITSLITHLIWQKDLKNSFTLFKKIYLGILTTATLVGILSIAFYQIFGSYITTLTFLLIFFGCPTYPIVLIIEFFQIRNRDQISNLSLKNAQNKF